MQEAIRRAIEGGYDNAVAREIYNDYLNADTITINRYGGILLDPEFWRSLGKAENWIEYMGDGTPYLTYQRYWKELIDHLAEGKDIESYFKELLN